MPSAFVVNRLADVVQQTGALGKLNICAQFRSHQTRQMADLDGVLQDVLSVGGAVLQATQQLDQLVVDAVLIRLENSGFTGLANLVFDFLLRLLDHFFDAGQGGGGRR